MKKITQIKSEPFGFETRNDGGMNMKKITLQIYKDELGNVHGAVMPLDGPGEYAIVLNRNETGPEQLAAFIHEMIHIYNNDLQSIESVQQIEREAHAAALGPADPGNTHIKREVFS